MFVHLHVHSPFSFLDGASTIEDLVSRAASLSMPAMALTDHDNLCGAVPFYQAALNAGIKPIIGVEATLDGGAHLILLAQNRQGYANLCVLLSKAHLNNPRGEPKLSFTDLFQHADNLIALSGCRRGEIPSLLLKRRYDGAAYQAQKYIEIFGRDNFFIELSDDRLPGSKALNDSLAELAKNLKLKTVATANAHYATKSRFAVHDLLTCVREQITLEDVHRKRRLNAENYLKASWEMGYVKAKYPEALENTLRIADRCELALPQDENLFPSYQPPQNMNTKDYLERVVFAGAQKRYQTVTAEVKERLRHELDIITGLGFQDYFLAVWDLARFARHKDILFAGRGSAADSLVAYCLGITEVDSLKRGLLFERFLSIERAQKPDIDIDFDARFRDEVANYVYKKYGESHVGGVCTYSTFRARQAIRDVGKAMGFNAQQVDRLAKSFPPISASRIKQAVRELPELRGRGLDQPRYNKLFELAQNIAGFPRHIGTHLGGIVVSGPSLKEVTPLQMANKGMVISQFDKRCIEEVGLIKLDLLSLRMLSAVKDTAASIKEKDKKFRYKAIPHGDKETYRMLGKGETVGVFQLESPAQRSLQSRLRASGFKDIVASVALIRPGPIKGNMVEPFINRRSGKEKITYIHPSLKPILEETYGVVLFQEQVIEIATKMAGFTPGEADRLRKAMTHCRSEEDMGEIAAALVAKAVSRGVSQEVAETIASYIIGYAGYGFCEAHAAAFGDTAYKTAYLLAHHPAEFYAAILSNQPMGFYPPHTICVEASRRGIRILGPDINKSGGNFTAKGRSIRVSLSQIKGIGRGQAEQIVEERKKNGNYKSLPDLIDRTGLNKQALKNLILCGAVESLHRNRRRTFWNLSHFLKMNSHPRDALEFADTVSALPDYSPWEKTCFEYQILGFGVTGHLLAFKRRELSQNGIITTRVARKIAPGTSVSVAGIAIRPHTPPTRSGKTIVFLTLEDEYGLLDATVLEDVYAKYASVIFYQPLLVVEGVINQRGSDITLIAKRIEGVYKPEKTNRNRRSLHSWIEPKK